MSEETKRPKKEIYYMPKTFALAKLLEQGYTRRQADDICWWAHSEEFQRECEKRGIDISKAHEEKLVRLYLKMYHPKPEGEIIKMRAAQPLAGTGNFIIGVLFIATFVVTLWLVL